MLVRLQILIKLKKFIQAHITRKALVGPDRFSCDNPTTSRRPLVAVEISHGTHQKRRVRPYGESLVGLGHVAGP